MEEIEYMEFYHVLWKDKNGTNPCYYVEGTRQSNGDILAVRWKVTSFIRDDGKRIRVKYESTFYVGVFPATAKIRVLKNNPFKN